VRALVWWPAFFSNPKAMLAAAWSYWPDRATAEAVGEASGELFTVIDLTKYDTRRSNP
jgi:hypothetical protein